MRVLGRIWKFFHPGDILSWGKARHNWVMQTQSSVLRSKVQLSFFPLKQNGHKLLALGKKVSHFLQHHFSAECNLENENPFSRKSHFFFYWPAEQQLTMGTVKSQTMHIMSVQCSRRVCGFCSTVQKCGGQVCVEAKPQISRQRFLRAITFLQVYFTCWQLKDKIVTDRKGVLGGERKTM